MNNDEKIPVNLKITPEQKEIIYDYAHNSKKTIIETFDEIINTWIKDNHEEIGQKIFNPEVKETLNKYLENK